MWEVHEIGLPCDMEDKKIAELFSEVKDPRVQGRCTHKLGDILFIALCTFLSNGEDFQDMEEFAKQRN